MGKIKDLITELDLYPHIESIKDLADIDIDKFLLKVAWRKKMWNYKAFWNGTYFCEVNIDTGEYMITNFSKTGNYDFPLSINLNISDKCNFACPWCYRDNADKGYFGDIESYIDNPYSFIHSIQPYTTINVSLYNPIHPDLLDLLHFCRSKKIFVNLSVSALAFQMYAHDIDKWLNEKLITRLTLTPALFLPGDEILEYAKNKENVTIAVQAGIPHFNSKFMDTVPIILPLAYDQNINLYIEGFEYNGEAVSYMDCYPDAVDKNLNWFRSNLKDFVRKFKKITLDSKAVEDLDLKLNLPKSKIEKINIIDSSACLNIDIVNDTYSSSKVRDNIFFNGILNDVQDMFDDIKGETL